MLVYMRSLLIRPHPRSPCVMEEEDEEDGLALCEEESGLEEEEVNVPSNIAKVRRAFRLLELRAYAHESGDGICMHQVGKWNVTANCVTTISDAVEANKLVKIRVLNNLDKELVDTASQLEGKLELKLWVGWGDRFLLSIRKLKAGTSS